MSKYLKQLQRNEFRCQNITKNRPVGEYCRDDVRRSFNAEEGVVESGVGQLHPKGED